MPCLYNKRHKKRHPKHVTNTNKKPKTNKSCRRTNSKTNIAYHRRGHNGGITAIMLPILLPSARQTESIILGTSLTKRCNYPHIGVIANVFWHEIKKHANFIELGEFVVMPNHIHGILIIDKSDENIVINDDNDNVGVNVDVGVNVETRHALSLQIPQQSPQPKQLPQPQSPGQKRFRNQGKNTISSIVGGYKSVVTNHAHRLGYDFAWQSRFHDNIIKDEKSYQYIANYIINNPVNWENDRFYMK